MTRRPLSFALLLPPLLSAQLVAADSYLPALPAITQTLGSTSTSLTVFTLTFDIEQLPMGSLTDHFGRRQIPLIGLTCYALAALVDVLATTTSMLTATCALQGLLMAAVLVYARATIRGLHPARGGPYVMARGLVGLGFVALMAPTLGTFVTQHTGWRWVLVGMSFYAIVLWAMCWYGFVRTRHETPAQADSVRAIFSSADFRIWGLLAAATYAGIFCSLLLLPIVYIAYLGLSPELYGWIPTDGPLVYILSTTEYRCLLHR